MGSTTGSNYYVRILSTIDRELLKPSASVALHKHSNALVDVLPPEADSSISMLQAGKFNLTLKVSVILLGAFLSLLDVVDCLLLHTLIRWLLTAFILL